MLDVRIHDKYQIEFKTHYRFQQQEKRASYTIEIYTFIPNNLNIDSSTYPKYQFYRDLQTYLRFETPGTMLCHLDSEKECPFQSLQDSFSQLAKETTEKNISSYENQIKMFGCIFRKAISEHIAFISEKDDFKDIDILVGQYQSYVLDILEKVRSLRFIITLPSIDEKLFNKYVLIDEYLSLVVDEYTYRLLEVLKQKKLPNWGQHKKRLLQLITGEIEYRKSRDYIGEPKKDDDNEKLIYKMHSLRTYTESVLFLKTRSQPEGKFAQQLIFGAAAGLAMIWATTIALYVQYKYGIFTMTFFVTLVVSYIFKDRIKEGIRDYLSNKLLRILFDQKTRICTSIRKKKIGDSRESFSFTTHDDIDDEIRKLRRKDQVASIRECSVRENIIHYRKKVNIFPRLFEPVYKIFNIEGVTDITRYNVARLTKKMGDPKRHLFITDGEDYKRTDARKIYRINFVVKYTDHNKTGLKRFRVIMDRDGIRRLEEEPDSVADSIFQGRSK